MSNQWTDERIKTEFAKRRIGFASGVSRDRVLALMGLMRDELTADDHRLTQHCNDLNNEVQELRQKLATERADTMTMKAAWIDTAGDYGTLLQKYESIVDLVNSGFAPSTANLHPNDDLVHEYYQRIVNILDS